MFHTQDVYFLLYLFVCQQWAKMQICMIVDAMLVKYWQKCNSEHFIYFLLVEI